MLLRSAELELLFGLSEALVSARQLLGWGGVERIMPEDAAITYQPILEHHDLMLVDGCWTATLFLEPLDLIGLRDRAPDWAQHLAKGHLRPVRSALDDWEVSLLTPPVPAEVRRPAQVSQSA